MENIENYQKRNGRTVKIGVRKEKRKKNECPPKGEMWEECAVAHI